MERNCTRRNDPKQSIPAATGDVPVARERGGLGVSDKLADILSDWLDTIESVADGDILLVTFAMMFSDAGKDENTKCAGNLANNWQDSAVLHSHYPQDVNTQSVFLILLL